MNAAIKRSLKSSGSPTRRLVVLTAMLAVATHGFAQQPQGKQARRIDRLIGAVASRDGATFVRNGKAYTAADAGRFLRGKLDKLGKDVTTAEEFIAKVASRSSTTGLIYQVRLPDGSSMPSEQFLLAELAQIDARQGN